MITQLNREKISASRIIEYEQEKLKASDLAHFYEIHNATMEVLETQGPAKEIAEPDTTRYYLVKTAFLAQYCGIGDDGKGKPRVECQYYLKFGAVYWHGPSCPDTMTKINIGGKTAMQVYTNFINQLYESFVQLNKDNHWGMNIFLEPTDDNSRTSKLIIEYGEPTQEVVYKAPAYNP